MRTLILGPLQSPKYVQVDEEFYNQSKLVKENHKLELVLKIVMNTDYSREVMLTLSNLKLFAKIDLLLVLQSYFSDSIPVYTHR